MAGASEIRRGVEGGVVRSPAAEARPYTLAAGFLVSLVAVAVPVGAALTGLPVATLFPAAVVAYLLAVTAAGFPFEGLCAALVVTTAFNVAAPVTTVPWVQDLWLRYVDVLAVAVLAALAVREARDPLARPGRGELVVVAAFAAFVCWCFLAAAVGNGPSPHDAFLYAIDQLRSLAVLCAAALFVRRTDARCVVGPLTVGLGGALVLAADEVFAGGQPGAGRLGVVGRWLAARWPSPSLTSFPMEATEVYDGVPIGQSRLMVGMALLFLALLLAAAARSGRHAPLAAAAPLGIASVLVDESHAALLALYALAAILALWLAHRALDRYGCHRARRLLLPAAALAAVAVVAGVLAAVFADAERVLLLETDTLAVRVVQYELAVELAARHPLFGVGGEGNYRLLTGRWIHNLPLANLAATGVPGFLAYLTSLAAATLLAVRRLRRRPAAERWLWVGVLGAMAVFYTYTSWVIAHRWESVNATYWLLVGVVVGAGGTGRRAAGEPEPEATAGVGAGATGEERR